MGAGSLFASIISAVVAQLWRPKNMDPFEYLGLRLQGLLAAFMLPLLLTTLFCLGPISLLLFNYFQSHTLGRILIAATLASDYGRQIGIGERLLQTKLMECILRSPELILLVFSSTYSAFAQLFSVCILIPALRPKTPYLIREHITDQMFLLVCSELLPPLLPLTLEYSRRHQLAGLLHIFNLNK
ncbi:hypothetical protein T11_233 [Trichinella zimbabwensis]|uniref:Uncharacterized protein n=1 Tax=Trichinella zimbabwensis TaxID=268475 RepID=A0A0V1HM21_9BILA|nr:hypothetical protein T11_233 [Trichinella zimbabwensis]